MSAEQIAGLAVALIIMLGGTIGAVVPVLPGAPIILAAAVGHKLYFGDTGASWLVIAALAVFMALSYVVDYAGQALGAKKLGATWKGITGAVVGGLVGLFFSIPGILLGPFVGAMTFELIGGRPVKPAAKAGVGAVLGLLIGAVGKIAICVTMMLLFAVSVIMNS